MPFSDMIFDSDVPAQDFVAPAVVIARNPENRHAALAKIGKRCKGAEAAAWNHRLPLEPEVEEIAVDQQGTSPALQTAEKPDERPLDIDRCDTEVRVGDDVAGSWQHPRMLVAVRIHNKREDGRPSLAYLIPSCRTTKLRSRERCSSGSDTRKPTR